MKLAHHLAPDSAEEASVALCQAVLPCCTGSRRLRINTELLHQRVEEALELAALIDHDVLWHA
eukprot:2175631-Pyramimonas_sp.AAC.1